MKPDVRRRAFRSLIVAAAAAVILSLTGAFDTGDRPFLLRLPYWLMVMGVGAALGQAVHRLLDRREAIAERPWLHILLLAACVALPMCLFVWAATGWIFRGELYPLSRLPLMIVPVLTVSLAVSALVVLLSHATPVQTHAAAQPAPASKFIGRLPPRLRHSRLIAVAAEDHYLRVYTDSGSGLILMRLSDALDELAGIEGAQTHRSWWVARDAVRSSRRHDGRATLTLDGGVTAPVSRRYARALKESGWL